jgi:hypothetical protein
VNCDSFSFFSVNAHSLEQRFYNLFIDKQETVVDENYAKVSIKVSKNKDGDPIINGQLKVLQDLDNLVVITLSFLNIE